MQARRISRELALLSVSQFPANPEHLDQSQLQSLVVAAVRTLTAEVRETLEIAVSELERGNNRLLTSETRAADIQSSRAMTREAIDLTQSAINRLGHVLDLPEFIELANQQIVREYALELLRTLKTHRKELDQLLGTVMIDWQVKRLVRLDQDILRLAIAEMMYLGIPNRIAINEAIELAKRYGEDDSHRFVNGVLRRVADHLDRQKLTTLPPS